MHVISDLDMGGAEGMLVRLLRGLGRDSFSQTVVSLTGRGVYGDDVEAAGVPLLTLGMNGFTATPRSLEALCYAIRGEQPSIIQTWLYHADLLGLMAARLTGDAHVAWNIRCSRLESEDTTPSTHLLIRLLSRLSSRPDVVLFNSNAGQRDHLAIGYRPRRSEVIPNGFDVEDKRPDALRRAEFRAEMEVDDRTFLVGMVARSHRMKDRSTFLAAAARLKDAHAPIRFVLVGLNHDWNDGPLVAEIDDHGLRSHIRLLGLRHDIPRVMAGLDCLVSTSRSGEGCPNVIGEAMACGVPCVATDVGDSRLVIGHTGVVVPIGDVAGVVAGVSQLMAATHEERQNRSEHCRRRIIERFDLRDVAARYADIYRELYDGRAARSRQVMIAPAASDVILQQAVPAAVGQTARSAPVRNVERRQSRFGELFVEGDRRRGAGAWETSGAITGWWQRLSLRRAAVAAIVSYALIFHTPIVWVAGNYLTIRQAPRPADAIVVFSGNGESTYINDSYQRRARDAAQYFKSGYAPLLVISSGITQTFAEVEIIRALLLSQGVPPSAIDIVTRYPSSTRQNVELVAEVLKRRGATSILFITAPYHSKRASLIWQKAAPDIRVTTVPVVDTPPASPQWTATLDQVEAIGYEYLAIVYNRFKGWL